MRQRIRWFLTKPLPSQSSHHHNNNYKEWSRTWNNCLGIQFSSFETIFITTSSWQPEPLFSSPLGILLDILCNQMEMKVVMMMTIVMFGEMNPFLFDKELSRWRSLVFLPLNPLLFYPHISFVTLSFSHTYICPSLSLVFVSKAVSRGEEIKLIYQSLQLPFFTA